MSTSRGTSSGVGQPTTDTGITGRTGPASGLDSSLSTPPSLHTHTYTDGTSTHSYSTRSTAATAANATAAGHHSTGDTSHTTRTAMNGRTHPPFAAAPASDTTAEDEVQDEQMTHDRGAPIDAEFNASYRHTMSDATHTRYTTSTWPLTSQPLTQSSSSPHVVTHRPPSHVRPLPCALCAVRVCVCMRAGCGSAASEVVTRPTRSGNGGAIDCGENIATSWQGRVQWWQTWATSWTTPIRA